MFDQYSVVLSDGTPYLIPGIMCHVSKFFAAWPLAMRARGAPSASENIDAFNKGWKSWAGPPRVLTCDPLTAQCAQEMKDYCRQLGIRFDPGPVEGKSWLAALDAKICQLKEIFTKVDNEQKLTKNDEASHWIGTVTTAMNQYVKHNGWSPYHDVFGRDPWLPTSLLSGESSLPALSAVLYDDGARRAELIRQAAVKATMEPEDMEAIGRAVHARHRDPYLPRPGHMV